MKAIINRNLLTSATETLVNSAGFTEHNISLEMLEGVARMRYCLCVAAELLLLLGSEQAHTQYLCGRDSHQLLKKTRYNHDVNVFFLYMIS